MKAFVITLAEVPESQAAAERCIASGAKFGLTIEKRPGVWRDGARLQMEAEGLWLAEFDESYSNVDAVIGNFVAQYRVWQEISRGIEPAVIMEHDAVVVAEMPNVLEVTGIINLGRPSFGKVPTGKRKGFYPLFSRGNKIPGAHGYYLSPAWAANLVSAAKRKGVMPVDLFISPQRFPGILEYFPWPIEAHDTFTTIQKVRGCESKHNYGAEYRIL